MCHVSSIVSAFYLSHFNFYIFNGKKRQNCHRKLWLTLLNERLLRFSCSSEKENVFHLQLSSCDFWVSLILCRLRRHLRRGWIVWKWNEVQKKNKRTKFALAVLVQTHTHTRTSWRQRQSNNELPQLQLTKTRHRKKKNYRKSCHLLLKCSCRHLCRCRCLRRKHRCRHRCRHLAKCFGAFKSSGLWLAHEKSVRASYECKWRNEREKERKHFQAKDKVEMNLLFN